MVWKILAKMLMCDLADVDNVLLHIPVGIGNTIIPITIYVIFGWPGALIGGALALVFGIGFVAYEAVEGAKIKDKIYPDIAGWLWGIGLSVIVTLVVYLCAGPLI
jgi:hypothetical protein